jgi:hypothetical protein
MGGTSSNVSNQEKNEEKKVKKVLTKEEFIKLKGGYTEWRRRKMIKDAINRNKIINIAKSNGQASEDYIRKTSNEKSLKIEMKKADYLHEKNLNKKYFDTYGLLKENKYKSDSEDDGDDELEEDDKKETNNLLFNTPINLNDNQEKDFLIHQNDKDEKKTNINVLIDIDLTQKLYSDLGIKIDKPKDEYDIKDIFDILLCKINTDSKTLGTEKVSLDDILPKNNILTNYYVSYFIAKMKDESTILLPFMVKLDKYLIKSYLYENYINDKKQQKHLKVDNYFKINSINEKWNLKETILNLINKTNDFNMSLQNKIIVENNIVPIFEKIVESNYLVYDCLDIKLMLEYYEFYLNLYGSDNIKYINLIWDTIDSSFDVKKDYFMNLNPELFTDKTRKDDFNVIKEDVIQLNNIENFLFKLDDLYDFKDVFKYKLENCLQYRFGENIEVEQILDYFKVFRDFNNKKNMFQDILYKNNVDKTKNKFLDTQEKILIRNEELNPKTIVYPFLSQKANDSEPQLLGKNEKQDNLKSIKIVNEPISLNNNISEEKVYDLRPLESVNFDIKQDKYLLQRGYDIQPLNISPNLTNLEKNDLKNMTELPNSNTYWFSNPFEKINNSKNQYTDLSEFYEKYDNKNRYLYVNNNPYFFNQDEVSLDSFYTSPLDNIYEKENKKKNKLDDNDENNYIFVIYNKDEKEGNIFEMKISKEFEKIVQNNFDIWFGNDFDMYKFIDKNKIKKDTDEIMKEFKDKKYVTKNTFIEQWVYMENIFMKEKTNKVRMSKKMDIKDCVQILNKYFEWNDNVENRIRSTELSNLFLEKINDYLGKMNNYMEEYDFIPLFLDIVKELNLKKKRYSAGNFYYGILEKTKIKE